MAKQDKKRYLIVGTGRTGSSLLASILSDAGGNFGIGKYNEWDRSSGSYEHSLLHEAYKWYHRSKKISNSLIPDVLGKKYCKKKAYNKLNNLFERVDFAKSTQLVSLVQEIDNLGYDPKIIVSYRNFGDYCASRYKRFGWGYKKLKDTYINVNYTALLQLKIFGGVTVSYGELLDFDDKNWIEPLSKLTNLEAKEIQKYRQKRVKKPRRRHSISLEGESTAKSTDEIYSLLSDYKGKVVNPIE